MTKQLKRLLILLILLIAVTIQTPLARAKGGLVVRTYWTFRTDAPVTHVQTGDINGDGVSEVVLLTADNVVHVVENDGTLAWRYEIGDKALELLVADMDGDGRTAEIFVEAAYKGTLLSNMGKPVWTEFYSSNGSTAKAFAADINGNGQKEILIGYQGGGVYLLKSDIGEMSDTHSTGGGWPINAIWAGDVDGDGQPEIVPSRVGSFTVHVYEEDFDLTWERRLDNEIALVRGADLDGDGQGEVLVLTTSGSLLLLDSNGELVWQQPLSAPNQDTKIPVSTDMVLQDLDGDDRFEIVVLAETTVYANTGSGEPIWRQSLAQPRKSGINTEFPNGEAGFLAPCPGDSRGSATVLVKVPGQKAVNLLAADGHRLAEYQVNETMNTLTCADLNGDSQSEIIVGAETGIHVYGISDDTERTELWTIPGLGRINALSLADLDGDGRDEIVAGSRFDRLFVLTSNRRFFWDVPVGAPIRALDTGDLDGDGQVEVVAGGLLGEGQLSLLKENKMVWTIPLGYWTSSIAIRSGTFQSSGDSSEARPEIVAGIKLLDNSNAVLLVNHEGEVIWRHKLDEPVSTVGNDGEQVLVGTETGQVYRLAADGEVIGEYNLGTKILSLEAGLAPTREGKIYRLDGDTPALVHNFGETLTAVQLDGIWAIGFAGGRFSLMSNGEVVWQGTVEDEIASIAAGDVNGDGDIEVAVGTESGQVHLFGLALDQPPFLVQPDLSETRTGYAYRVDVIDPEGDAVPVILEIWDPSANTWQSQAAQSLDEGQDRGELTWDISEPFDIWDSGQESRFRFVYEFDGQQTTTEIPGPFNIPTTPWYLYYGQRLGLGIVILLVPALGLVLYRRQQAYRRSPVGRAEALLKHLQAQPDEILRHLHTLTNDNPALLPYLSGVAREAGETALADLSEGHNLLLVRPEVTVEDLRLVTEAIGRLNEPSDEQKTTVIALYGLFQQALEANTVNRIVSLSVQLHQLLTEVEAELGQALNDLNEVMKSLNNFQRVEAVEDKTAYLGQALEALGRLEREFRMGSLWQPEATILARIAANWLLAVNHALQDLQGRARIEASLKSRHLLNLDQASLSLELTNTGRSPASNVIVSLVPDQTFVADNGPARLDLLAAGRSAVVELSFSAAPTVEQFRAEFKITFDDRERRGKSLAFADMVQLLRPVAEFQTMPNPYAPGTPLASGSPIFFGRDDLFKFVTQNIAGLTRQNILVLIGQRRMGKTSFLQQLPARLGQDYLPVYLDGQSLGIDPGMANFFYDLSLAIVDALVDQGLELEEPALEDFQERPSGTFERIFLPRLFEAIGGRQLLFLFDEFEELEMRVNSGKLEATIFPFLRHLMQHNQRLGFIFVGTHRLEALSSDYWSIFFNIALYKHVVFLDEAAARALITEPVAPHGLIYDDLALDKMLRVTAGHPYFLQLTCHALINRANREQRGYLTIQDVNSVLHDMVELGEAHFAFLWEQSTPSEQLMLSALTRLLGQEPTVTASQLVALLAERGITRDGQEVTETLRQLVGRDVLREIAGQPPRYEYKVELVRLWIERYKAFGRVAEEVA